MKLSTVRKSRQMAVLENLKEIHELFVDQNQDMTDDMMAARLGNFKDKIEMFLAARTFENVETMLEGEERG
jgi:hypothetical protein